MITPRQTRLFRAADLRTFRRTIQQLIDHKDVRRTRDSVILVPSVSAADQLRRTFENRRLASAGGADRALWLPHILNRSGWYDAMHSRLPSPPRRLGELEREVLLNAAAREAANRVEAPFRLRAGLLVAMLAMYDDLRRRDSSVDDFERRLTHELERDADIDRGAGRLLKQTAFLAAAFRGYEARRDATGGVDEYALRTHVLQTVPARPIRHVVVTVGDRNVDAAGLWPADFDLLTRLPLLEQIDVVATHATIAAGLLDRLEKFMPGFEDAEPLDVPAPEDDGAGVVLVAPSPRTRFTVYRDREEELGSIAASIKVAGQGGLDRRAVVFKRPLPYVYLARDVFDDARVPYQTYESLPLAAEPYAAAVDLVFEFVSSNFTRESVVALLGSPHFSFTVEGAAMQRPDVAALNRTLSEAGYFGGVNHLRLLAESGGQVAARAAVGAAEELLALLERRPPSAHLGTLLAFLESHDRIPPPGDQLRDRHLRARHAVVSAITDLRRAHADLDDEPADFLGITAMIRRWIEGQTFAPRTGDTGVQLLDAQAARYGEFDQVFLVGLVEGEWPERAARNIFYPASLLGLLDWPDARAALAGERALFQDLVRLAGKRVHLSAFELEDDAVTSPSVFLEDLERMSLGMLVRDPALPRRVLVSQALTADDPVFSAFDGEEAAWLALRAGRSKATDAQFHGRAEPYRPPAFSVSALERYLQCPFRFFAERVLTLQEDPEDEATLNPKELGIFVHTVFQKFFEEWNRRGHRGITPANLPEARVIFTEIVEPLLNDLDDAEAAVQRTRLLGSAVDEGLAEAVFQTEAEWGTPVVERLLEYSLEGEFDVQGPEGMRRIPLRGKADRIDLLQDGTFRIIDYKLSRAPERKQALQLPVYTVCAVQHLRQQRGEQWEPGQAGYIAFGQERQFVPMLARGKGIDETLLDAQRRLLEAVDRIERGEFPPTPVDTIMCTRCAHAAVCRKDYVGDV